MNTSLFFSVKVLVFIHHMLSNMPSHNFNEDDALYRYIYYKHETICLFSCIDLIQNCSHEVISSIRDFLLQCFHIWKIQV